MREVHFSELQAAWRCEQKWNGLYREQLVSVQPLSLALRWGTAFHRLAAADELQQDEVQLADLQLEEADTSLLFAVFKAWRTWWPVWKAENKVKVLAVEHQLRVSPGGFWDVDIVGTADYIVEADGLRWLLDIKTTDSPQQNHFPLDMQGLTYAWLDRQLGNHPLGMIYVQVRKTDPARARVPLFIPTWQPFGPTATAQFEPQLLDCLQWVLDNYDKPAARYTRRFNPLSWMSCVCPLEGLCQAWLQGREAEAKQIMYKNKEQQL